MRYLNLDPEDLPLGQKALMLYVVDGALSAGILEHRCDGRQQETTIAAPGPDGVVPTIMTLLGPGIDHLYVVLDDGAYWPESFPPLESLYARPPAQQPVNKSIRKF